MHINNRTEECIWPTMAKKISSCLFSLDLELFPSCGHQAKKALEDLLLLKFLWLPYRSTHRDEFCALYLPRVAALTTY